MKALKGQYKNFTLGVHTVISNFNVDEFETIYAFVRDELKPDSFISEIAEERVELDTVGMGITPSAPKYQSVIERLQEGIRKAEFNGVSRVTQAFRDQYYDIVKRTLAEKRQVIPCLAGVASAQIAPMVMCGRAVSARNRWATCVNTTTILRRPGEPRKPTSCAEALKLANAIVLWRTHPIPICSVIFPPLRA